jgi:hypothetical protein
LDYLTKLDNQVHALPGLTGPLWFTPDHGRQQAVRVGRFHGVLFECAPLQLVPIPNPEPAEIDAGTVVDLGSDSFGRRQRVVYSGFYLNEISRVDVAQARFTADFYLWMRYALGSSAGADPTDIEFPELVRGSSKGKSLAAEGDLANGTTYRLWHMRGDFKNDFDLQRVNWTYVKRSLPGRGSRAATRTSPAASASAPTPDTTSIAARARECRQMRAGGGRPSGDRSPGMSRSLGGRRRATASRRSARRGWCLQLGGAGLDVEPAVRMLIEITGRFRFGLSSSADFARSREPPAVFQESPPGRQRVGQCGHNCGRP